MTINWRPLTEYPTDHWERNNAISNPKLVLYRANGSLKIGWDQYSYISNLWLISYMSHEVIAWADISEEEFLKQVKIEIEQ